MGEPGSDASEGACACACVAAAPCPQQRRGAPAPAPVAPPPPVRARAPAGAPAEDDDEAASPPLAPALAELIALSFLSVSRSGPASPVAACDGAAAPAPAPAAGKRGGAPPQADDQHRSKRRLSVPGCLDDAAGGARDQVQGDGGGGGRVQGAHGALHRGA
jgi:hypothetical protein